MNIKYHATIIKTSFFTTRGTPICTTKALEGCYPHEIIWHDKIAKTPDGIKRRLKRRKEVKYRRDNIEGSMTVEDFLDALEKWESLII